MHPPLCGSCSSGQRFACGFLQILPHDSHPCRSANTSPCRVCKELPRILQKRGHLQADAPCRAHTKKRSSFIWTTLDSGNIPLKSQNGRSSFSSETDGGAPGVASSRPSDPPADSPRSWREPSMTRSFATISVTYRLLPSLPS